MRISRENTVGLMIDIQERLFPVMHEKETLLKNCKILIQGLAVHKVPLVVTQQYTRGLGETLPEISSLIADFKYIEKTDFSCYDVAEVREQLAESKAKNIILFGIESHVCVLQTAVDMKAAGLNPIVIMDAVSSRTPQNIDLAKERYRHEEIMMTSYESLLFELTRKAGTEEFKAISKLVK
ncbi:MAG TPA: isochorismatase family protein [Draconibacterium sp.]|nr:isochorismatase family protein [Draconibacterium sp.]